MSKTFNICLLGALVAMWTYDARADCPHEAERKATIDVAGAKRLVVRAGPGALNIRGESGRSQLDAIGRACADSAADLRKLTMEVSRDGATVTLTAAPQPEAVWTFTGDPFYLDVTVRVPAELAVKIEDGSGDIEVVGVAELDVHDGSGDLQATRIAGNVRIDDGSGEVRIETVGGDLRLADGSGTVTIDSVRGNLLIEDDGSGDLNAQSVAGNVRVVDDGSGEIRIRKVNGHVHVEGDGSGGIYVDEVRQDVTIGEDGSGEIVVSQVGGDFTVRSGGSGGVQHSKVLGHVQVQGRD